MSRTVLKVQNRKGANILTADVQKYIFVTIHYLWYVMNRLEDYLWFIKITSTESRLSDIQHSLCILAEWDFFHYLFWAWWNDEVLYKYLNSGFLVVELQRNFVGYTRFFVFNLVPWKRESLFFMAVI